MSNVDREAFIIDCRECGEEMTLHGGGETKTASLRGGTCIGCERE